AIYLDGHDAPDRAEDGSFLIDDDFLLLINSWWEPLDFVLPTTREWQQCWSAVVDTFQPSAVDGAPELLSGETRTVGARSVVVLRAPSAQIDSIRQARSSSTRAV